MPSIGIGAKQDIERLLQTAAPEGSRVRVVINADTSVDGELLAYVPHGQNPEELINDLEAAISVQDFSLRVWYATGFRFEPHLSAFDGKPIESGQYNSRTGLSEIWSHYYNDLPRADAACEAAIEETRQLRYRKAQQVVVRVHWNRYGKRPPREG